MQSLFKFGYIFILGVYGAVGSIVPYQSSSLEKVNGNLIPHMNSCEFDGSKNVSETSLKKYSEPSRWTLTSSYIRCPNPNPNSKTVCISCQISEEDQYEAFRERVIEKEVPILIKKNFIANADGETSQIILTRYIEVNDVEELKVQDRCLELFDPKEIDLPNQREIAGWQNDDFTLTSKQLSKIYAEYEGEKFYIDQEARFRDGNVVQGYVLDKTESIRSRTFEDGVHDCVESIPHNHYKRPDGSKYIQLLSAEIQKTHKPIKTKQVGWKIDDSKLIATQNMQDFVISGGKELNVGAAKNGAIQGYVKENEVTQCVGKLTFVSGRLEQKKVATVNYRRPDGSLYTINNVPFASEIQAIPHSVTYSAGGWKSTNDKAFRQGTFQAFKGCFAVVDLNMLTKYQADGTMIRRAALPPELAAFAPTKYIRHYWKKGGSVFHSSRTIPLENEEVLSTYPKEVYGPFDAGDMSLHNDIKAYKKKPINWAAIFAAE